MLGCVVSVAMASARVASRIQVIRERGQLGAGLSFLLSAGLPRGEAALKRGGVRRVGILHGGFKVGEVREQFGRATFNPEGVTIHANLAWDGVRCGIPRCVEQVRPAQRRRFGKLEIDARHVAGKEFTTLLDESRDPKVFEWRIHGVGAVLGAT